VGEKEAMVDQGHVDRGGRGGDLRREKERGKELVLVPKRQQADSSWIMRINWGNRKKESHCSKEKKEENGKITGIRTDHSSTHLKPKEKDVRREG